MKKLLYLTAVAASLPMLAVSCSSDECLGNSNSLPQAGFFSSKENPQTLSLQGLRIRALDVPGDSILNSGSSSIQTAYIPFNLDADHTSYEFAYLSQTEPDSRRQADTVTFYYTRQPWFVSSACGAVVNFNVERIEHTSLRIDSVTCPGKVITNAAGVNINIYFKVVDNEEI